MQLSLGKYREIIIAVAFFLLFDLAVRVPNFYVSFQIANTLAGNARRTLGKDLEISVPRVVHGKPSGGTRTRQHPYVITFRWNRYPGVVCVGLAEAA